MYARAVVRIVSLGIVLAALASCGPGEGESPAGALDAMIATERAFAQRSVETGMRQAFLDFLAEDSVLFFPVAVPGRQFMESRPEPSGQLEWAPGYADISAAGDLGYTTGPYKFSTLGPMARWGRPSGTATSSRCGNDRRTTPGRWCSTSAPTTRETPGPFRRT